MNGFCFNFDVGTSLLRNCPEQVITTDGWQHPVTDPDGDVLSSADGSRFMFDGYLLDADVEELAKQIARGNMSFLSTIDGHFSGILLKSNGDLVGFCDRFGGKTLYWQAVSASRLLVSSRADLMPVYDCEADALGHFEYLRYRCISGSRTFLRSIRQLPAYHTITFSRTTTGEISPYWQLPAPNYNSNPLHEKVTATKAALIASLKRARKHHNKAAILLSGGVDSSLLTALCKEVFDECLLVTPDFGDWLNPELERAKEFASILNLDHLVIQVEPSGLEQDLRELIALKREPLRHYSSLAMFSMMRAIPDDYRLVVYGCTADILFGMLGIKRLCAQEFDRNKLRGNILRFVNVLYSYSEAARLLVESITDSELVGHEGWRWAESIANTNASEVRYLTQQAVIPLEVVTHFKETGLIGERFSKQVAAPYYAPETQAVSATLSHTDFVGGEYVKPVLRELSCEYYPKELVYRKKLSFPVPLESWLNGPLNHLVKDVANERELFDGSKLTKISPEDDPSIYWLLINWRLVHEHFRRSALTSHPDVGGGALKQLAQSYSSVLTA